MSKELTLCTHCTTKIGCICEERLAEIEVQAEHQTRIEEGNAYEKQLEEEQAALNPDDGTYLSNGHVYWQRKGVDGGQEFDPICLD